MSHHIRWFVAGCVATALLIGVLALGVSLLSHPADAQGTWQVKQFRGLLPDEMGRVNSILAGTPAADAPTRVPNPDVYVEDWAATLPDSCDIVPTQDERQFLFRCP